MPGLGELVAPLVTAERPDHHGTTGSRNCGEKPRSDLRLGEAGLGWPQVLHWRFATVSRLSREIVVKGQGRACCNWGEPIWGARRSFIGVLPQFRDRVTKLWRRAKAETR